MIRSMPRHLMPERMDDPSLDALAHCDALFGLRRINAVSRTSALLLGHVAAFAGRRGMRSVQLLDVACGGGDVPLALVALARRRGLTISLTLADRSDFAVAHARVEATRQGTRVETVTCDALTRLPSGPFDVVTNSLFLHHLSESNAVAALTNMWTATTGLLLVSDLRRSAMGWIAAQVACRTLSRSPVVHYDGPVSVRGAWTISELHGLASQAGIPDARIGRTWPWRMLLEAERHVAK
jgi:2-polyprenyl-3-methyl-5-hydroxy-6-metoxy-1,4-benzoquinol methylase